MKSYSCDGLGPKLHCARLGQSRAGQTAWAILLCLRLTAVTSSCKRWAIVEAQAAASLLRWTQRLATGRQPFARWLRWKRARPQRRGSQGPSLRPRLLSRALGSIAQAAASTISLRARCERASPSSQKPLGRISSSPMVQWLFHQTRRSVGAIAWAICRGRAWQQSISSESERSRVRRAQRLIKAGPSKVQSAMTPRKQFSTAGRPRQGQVQWSGHSS